MSQIRSFIAIELSPPLRHHIEKIQNELRSTTADVRWVRSEGIHLTLKFLGAIDDQRIDEIGDSIEECLADKSIFTVTVGSLGAFPNREHPKVIWLGIEDECGVLRKVHQTIDTRLTSLGFTAEKRTFSPHLTLGRIKSPKGRKTVSQRLATMGKCECGTLDVKEIILFKSDLKPSGAVYTKLRSFVLRS
jgi:2'-5' RNA ligase